MADLSFKELREANRTRCEGAFHPIESWSPTDWACAMAGECGEACNLIKKLRRGDFELTEEIRLDVANELADIIIYADLLAERLGISLGKAVARKFNYVSAKRGSNIRLPES